MKLCIWLTADETSAKVGDPIEIRRWDKRQCIPRIGESYDWLGDAAEDLFEGLEIFGIGESVFRVTDIRHQSIPRSLDSFMRGRPKNFPMVMFKVPDPRILDWLLNNEIGWEEKTAKGDL